MDCTNYTGTDPHNATHWLVDLPRTILLSRGDMLIVRFVCELIINDRQIDVIKWRMMFLLSWNDWSTIVDSIKKKKFNDMEWHITGLSWLLVILLAWHLQSIVMHWCIYLWLNCLSLNILLSYSHIFVILCNENILRINYVYERRCLQCFAYAQTDLNRWHQGIFWSHMSVNILV